VNVTLRVEPERVRLILRNGSQELQKGTLRLRSRTAQGVANYSVRDISLPPGTRIIGRFTTWEGPAGRPSLWLDDGVGGGGLGVRVPVKRIAGI
jgi:hypothetical protein